MSAQAAPAAPTPDAHPFRGRSPLTHLVALAALPGGNCSAGVAMHPALEDVSDKSERGNFLLNHATDDFAAGATSRPATAPTSASEFTLP